MSRFGHHCYHIDPTPGCCAPPVPPFSGRIYLERVRLNKGGYTSEGRYFGTGEPLYYYSGDDWGISGYLRARDRSHAREQVLSQYPQAKVRR